MKDETVMCANGECGKTWPRDPVLEVECPKCHAPVGSPCVVKRPSGHVHTAKYAGLPSWGHDERDLEAQRQGKYGKCPLGECGRCVDPVDQPDHEEQLHLVMG